MKRMKQVVSQSNIPSSQRLRVMYDETVKARATCLDHWPWRSRLRTRLRAKIVLIDGWLR
jgi:hypothetical protein